MTVVLDAVIITKIFLSAAIGILVGLERSLSRNPAGTRTHALVCMGSCLFTIISLDLGSPTEFARVLPGIVTGIGFIGGGIIYQSRQGGKRGLTTAADIWSMAAVGILVGMGSYGVALVAALVILFILRPLKLLEKKLGIKTAL
ncbi:MAG: MgtC/SapB family protein [Candidatus Aenigmarchaeota archaeon]|nr:MgtC/SapB family protein [Candidatus Aenigmarchaeota archaeon]